MSQFRSSSNTNQRYNKYNRNHQIDDYDQEEYYTSNQNRQYKQYRQYRQYRQYDQYEQSNQYQNNKKNYSYENKTTTTSNKDPSKIKLKQAVKFYVRKEYKNRISEIKSDEIDMIVLNVYRYICKNKQNAPINNDNDWFSADELKNKKIILATVLGEIIKNVPHMEDGMLDYIESIYDKISLLIVKTEFDACETQKSVMGYNFINSFCWPGISKGINEDEYLKTLNKLMIYCNYDANATNDKNETALNAFENAVSKKKMQYFESVFKLLQTGDRKSVV